MIEPISALIATFYVFISLSFVLLEKALPFFGSVSGELVKNLVEFVVYAIVSYMLISEYRKTQSNELKYLVLGFLSLTVGRFAITFAYTYIIFTNITAPNISIFLPIIDNTLETLALVLVANAFIYPIVQSSKKIWKKIWGKKIWIKRVWSSVSLQLLSILIISVLLQIYWLEMHKFTSFNNSLAFLAFEVLRLSIFTYAILTINIGRNKQVIGKYANSIIFAFLLYLVSPVLNILNLFFYNSSNQALIIASHPFPLLSMLFFFRVVFLKLVDKATLRQELHRTQKKYEHEKDLSKMKDEFVSVVSHELRTPLTNIKLYLSLLKEGEFGTLSKKQKEPLKVLEDESERLNAMINNVLSLSKLEAGKQTLHLQNINLGSLVDSSVYLEMARKKGVVVENNIPQNMRVNVDEDLFKQVFTNLFSNALKFTENGGRIIFWARHVKSGIEIIVKDTGAGISKENMPHLFNKFYQAEHFMTRTKGGTGLGLSIVKKIIELHNGKITVISEKGRGTEFIISLPN